MGSFRSPESLPAGEESGGGPGHPIDSHMGLRYGLLAALTLVLASAILWDHLHPPRESRLDPREEVPVENRARIVVGGAPLPAPPASEAPRSPGPRGVDPEPAPGGSTPATHTVPGPVPGTDTVPGTAPVAPVEATYTVASGDTLGGIALRTLGSSRKAGDLARGNGMALDGVLRVGMVLRLPRGATGPAPSDPPGRETAPPTGNPDAERTGTVPAARRSHTVARGDTLYALARRYYGSGGDYRRIAEANRLAEDATLRTGQELLIP